MSWRPFRAAAMTVSVLSALSAVACSSGTSSPQPSATDSYSATTTRVGQLYPLFVQCLAQHSIPIWDKSQGNMNAASQGAREGWYKNGRVVTNDAFYGWLQQYEGTYPMSPSMKPEQPIHQWVTDAATKGTWPKVCGSLPGR